MNDISQQLSQSKQMSEKISSLLQKRLAVARDRYGKRLNQVAQGALTPTPLSADPWQMWADYGTDLAQRSVLFWDTLRQRGNTALEHELAGKPPVLHFDYEMVLDARHFEQPVNYALVRIVPPAGVVVVDKRRPYIIIDPRAGHGPGIGGFKDDSQVGVALREGHPVYFVIFFPEPEKGQTLLDVCAAEQRFVKEVRKLHPDSAKPAIVGNCQGGWAAMMLAAADPNDSGPVVINGAPMSYWSGALSEGEGDNPMRYAGGMLGGSWLSSLTADMGNGVFDGAYLVQNFESLNPANTYWDKYYNLFAKVDSEPPRFLEFERWWSGFYMMNKEEIEWIVQNLFVGNKLWDGAAQNKAGHNLTLRDIKAPIVVFASMGDNITPPQQAFNWVADTYQSTAEIKSLGQTIVGLMHEDVGHLGIFVSGKVAQREHSQIVSVLKSIESLPPGLYGMQISEQKAADGSVVYEVNFIERTLEEISKHMNRAQRVDEKPFEAVSVISDFNQRAYELFGQPVVQALSNDLSAKLSRDLHPLRLQYRLISDMNPALKWLAPTAAMVKSQRRAVGPDQPLRRAEHMLSELISSGLDLYRDLNNAMTENMFFNTYGNLYNFYLAGLKPQVTAETAVAAAPQNPRELPFVAEALAAINEGGYVEALTRLGALYQTKGEPLPLAHVQLKQELLGEYADLLPDLPRDVVRRIRGEQDVICFYEREAAIAAMPTLLSNAADRKRFLTLLEKVETDRRFLATQPSAQQLALLRQLRQLLPLTEKAAASKKTASKEVAQ